MLPMKADLQELMITYGEIKKIVGDFDGWIAICFVSVLLGSFPLFWFVYYVMTGRYRAFFHGYVDYVLFILAILITGLITILIMYFIDILDNKINQRVRLLLSEVEKHNQIITNLYTLDQLEAVGNPVKINDRVKVIEALRITREGLVRALKTERILRENPNFKPEYFNIDLTSLQAEKTMVKAIEYAQLLDQAVQIGVSVQKEMRKLQNNR
ncbi:hypothetical protein [Planktothrix agardhii]|uniref:hypothetical protein n=1 Tax=Planktothrix agardhii TaxID=1160 RepID=UPI00068645FF|nr:hypothetical protein [Planktothrix agardhii]